MQKSLIALVLLAATPGAADIRSADDCERAIAADPAVAREEAAVWARLGGGTTAELCEATALEAMGALGSAAALLTRLGEDPRRAHPAALRVAILEDAARLWLAAERPEVARQILATLDRLSSAGPARLRLAARVAAAEGDWPAALANLDALVAANPENAPDRALRAAALRASGDPGAARAEAEAALVQAPDQPEALFEAGAAAFEAGDPTAARDYWLRLIAAHPDHGLSMPARRNIANLN